MPRCSLRPGSRACHAVMPPPNHRYLRYGHGIIPDGLHSESDVDVLTGTTAFNGTVSWNGFASRRPEYGTTWVPTPARAIFTSFDRKRPTAFGLLASQC